MRVIIAGSRSIRGMPNIVDEAVRESGFEITEIVSGGAIGIDQAGEVYARWKKLDCVVFKANWTKYGLSAGPIRNVKMAEYAEALIAIWDGQSAGTSDVIEKAMAKGLKVFVKKIDKQE